LPPPGSENVVGAGTDTTLKASERTLILNALEAVGWVIGGSRGAAARLGLNRTTLINKMKRLGISRPELLVRRVEPRLPKLPGRHVVDVE
jgi:formate hydrogenlyase transcriptional activator